MALEYAETITRSDTQVDAGLIERLKNDFDDDEIVELTALIASQNMSSKFNSALAVPARVFFQRPQQTLSLENKAIAK